MTPPGACTMREGPASGNHGAPSTSRRAADHETAGFPRTVDVHAWIVAWVALGCHHRDDRAVPSLEWQAGDGPVTGIQVCLAVTDEAIAMAVGAGANVVVAARSPFVPECGSSVAAWVPVVRWGATFSRHGLSCIVASEAFVEAIDGAPVAPTRVASRVAQAFPDVRVVAFAP